jgi:predicted ATP-grasp superfamily ATP-dependent carboligase
MFNGYFNRDSECLFGMTGQKIRQSPAYTGSTCLGVCSRNDEVLALTLRFMKSIGYRGILDIGYRYDARDGKYKVLDVNPRIGSTFRLFTGDGDMDVARALYLDITGQTIQSTSPRYGRKWMVEDCDLASSIRYYRDGQLTVKDWLMSFRGVQETAFLSLRDPLPAAAVFVSDLQQFATRMFRRNGRASAGRASHPEHGLLSRRLGK